MSSSRFANMNILVVEDNSLDAVLLSVALKAGGFMRDPVVVDDGRAALELLQRKGFFADYETPDLVLLDLNLKQVDGATVLNFIRQAPELSNVRVAVLSSVPVEVMVNRAQGADGYFSKPSDLASYQRLGKAIMECYASKFKSAAKG